MRYAAVSAIECSSSVNGNGANEDPEGREREREKVAASLVRSLTSVSGTNELRRGLKSVKF